MCELIIDADLQSLLDARRANVERRAALYPNLRRYTADISPPTAFGEILSPSSTELGAAGTSIKESE